MGYLVSEIVHFCPDTVGDPHIRIQAEVEPNGVLTWTLWTRETRAERPIPVNFCSLCGDVLPKLLAEIEHSTEYPSYLGAKK